MISIKDSYKKLKKRNEIFVIDSRCVIFATSPLTVPPDCIKPDIMVNLEGGGEGKINEGQRGLFVSPIRGNIFHSIDMIGDIISTSLPIGDPLWFGC